MARTRYRSTANSGCARPRRTPTRPAPTSRSSTRTWTRSTTTAPSCWTRAPRSARRWRRSRRARRRSRRARPSSRRAWRRSDSQQGKIAAGIAGLKRPIAKLEKLPPTMRPPGSPAQARSAACGAARRPGEARGGPRPGARGAGTAGRGQGEARGGREAGARRPRADPDRASPRSTTRSRSSRRRDQGGEGGSPGEGPGGRHRTRPARPGDDPRARRRPGDPGHADGRGRDGERAGRQASACRARARSTRT